MSAVTIPGEYRIRAMNDVVADPNDIWVAVEHVPCEEFVFGDDENDADDLDVSTLLALIAAHCCPSTTEGV